MAPPSPSTIQQLDAKLAHLKRRWKNAGKGPGDAPAKTALQTEIQTQMDLIRDEQLTHRIAYAVETDADAVWQMTRADAQAQADHHLAVLMAAGSGEGQEHAVKHAAAQAENVFKATVQAQAETRPRGDKTDPSTSYVQQQAAALRQFAKVKPECNVCGTETKRADIARLPCGAHLFCKGCLKDHFLRAVNDQSLFPPHCCRKPIPLSMISAQLSASEVQAYKDAELEHTTPHKIYCSNPRCSKFIPPLRITKHKAKCKCGHSTCPRCKRPAHAKGDGCPEDPDLADVLKLGKKRGWQRCAKCLQMVEKTEGCDHMTCQCKYEFCYVCGGAYQKCKCVTGA